MPAPYSDKQNRASFICKIPGCNGAGVRNGVPQIPQGWEKQLHRDDVISFLDGNGLLLHFYLHTHDNSSVQQFVASLRPELQQLLGGAHSIQTSADLASRMQAA